MVTKRSINKRKSDKREARTYFRRRKATPKRIVVANVRFLRQEEAREVARKGLPAERRGRVKAKTKRGKAGGYKRRMRREGSARAAMPRAAGLSLSKRTRREVRAAREFAKIRKAAEQREAEAIRLKTVATQQSDLPVGTRFGKLCRDCLIADWRLATFKSGKRMWVCNECSRKEPYVPTSGHASVLASSAKK